MSVDDTTPTTRSAAAPSAAAVAISKDHHDRMSWAAVLAGLVCALALYALLTLLGLAWGFATIDPTEEVNPFAGLAMGGGAYWLFISIVSLFTGGWVAARTSGLPLTPAAVIHGVCVWALATLISLYFASSAVSTAAKGAAAAASAVASAGATTVEGAAEPLVSSLADNAAREIEEAAEQRDLTAADIRAELREMYREVISPREERRVANIAENLLRDVARTPGDFSSDISTGLDRMFGADGPLSQADREELEAALSARFGLSEAEAERIAARWQERWMEATERLQSAYADTAAQTEEAAEAAAEFAATSFAAAALAGFLSLLAAAIGGALGRPERYGV